jgi:predicted transcriptional regulator
MLDWSRDKQVHGSAQSDPALRIVMAYLSGNAVPPNRLVFLLTEMCEAVATLRSRHSLGSRPRRATPIKSSQSFDP